MAQLRLVFMGTADIAAPALKALVAAGHGIACVYTQPPRPAGRGQRERRTAIHDAADALGLAVRHPKSLKDAEAQKAFAALGADAAVVMAYGLILPGAVLDAPRFGCINIHASLLPRWRGAAPIQRAILAGDAATGVTIMQMDEGLDTGAMLLRDAVPIGPDTTAGALHDALAALGARLIVEALDGLAAGTLTPTPQPAEGATYARKLDRDEARLDWREDAAALERRVRGFDPWPGAWFAHDGARIRVAAAAVAPARPGAAPGTVLDDAPTVACGDGALRLLRLQRPGRAAMDAAAFLRGYALPPGTVLP
ncbi:MAG: methionyl-tRNA formyltransferase [Alphaproteobacteria bacterium]|nr:methionyl-tRNA formyltransferase [Alphaproteobacteria bacterium]